jgi:hypothetical protein
MTSRTEATATAIDYSHVNRFAHVIERSGLAIMGALCGFFVAALVAKANIVEINSVGALFSAILYGSIGLYMGTNIPSSPSGAHYGACSDNGSAARTNQLALVGATGTFLAAVAALVSVYMIVFDEDHWDRVVLGARRSAATRCRCSGTPRTDHRRPWLALADRIWVERSRENTARSSEDLTASTLFGDYRSHLSLKITGRWTKPAASLFRACFSRHFGPGPRI